MFRLSSLVSFVTIALLAAQVEAKDKSFNNETGTSSVTFPTDIGFAGKVGDGKLPFLAEMDLLNTTRSNHARSVEMRWLPYNHEKDHTNSDDIWLNQGASTPYHEAYALFPDMVKYSARPSQCQIKQVHVLHRHGAKYPDDITDSGPGAFWKKVQGALKNNTIKLSDDVKFLKDWDYLLGRRILTQMGAEQTFRSGVSHYYMYAKLLEDLKSHKPVIRTSSHSRVLDSAKYFMLGFFGWDAFDKAHLEVLTEEDGQNNSLASKKACTNADDDDFSFAGPLTKKWRSVYLKAPKARLEKKIRGINLTTEDVYNMMSACSAETFGSGYSDFCKLFTKEEWENFSYDSDLDAMGKHGFMNPTGRAQGVPWVQELVDRLLKHKPGAPVTAQNMTLNKNSTYFPLDQKLYVDFSHHSTMTGILTALNLTQFKESLDPKKPNPHRKFRTSLVTPHAMRLNFEVMECDFDDGKDTYIRLKLNDVTYPLDESNGCERRADGLCKLDDFTTHLDKNAYKASKWDLMCFGKIGKDFNLTGPVTDGVIPEEDIF